MLHSPGTAGMASYLAGVGVASSALAFHNDGINGANIRPAIMAALDQLRLNTRATRTLVIPYRPGGWLVDQQVLFNLSNFNLVLEGDIRLSGTSRQKTLLFAYDTSQQPAQALTNVSLFGGGRVVDGNADLMSFSYAHGDGSDNDSAVRFNYVDGVYFERLHATNGPIDSFSLRQCRNWLGNRMEFSRSKEDNGFSATTDWTTWVEGDPKTWGYGILENFTSHNNNDFGATAYNASGVVFDKGRSFDNRSGYSSEDAFSVKDVKKYGTIFRACEAYNCAEEGFLIDGDNVIIDDACKSRNIRGYAGDNSAHIKENGVVVSAARNVYVGGEHTNCGRAGLAIFNGSTLDINVKAAGKFNDNDRNGIFGRGVSRLDVLSRAEVIGNGKVSVASAYGRGIDVSNSGGATYLQGAGNLKVHSGATIRGNGLGAARSQYVKFVDIQGVDGEGNCVSGSDVGINVLDATTAKILDNNLPTTTGNQTFPVAVDATVTTGYEWGNTGTGSTGGPQNNATTKQVIRGEFYATATYDPPSIAAGSRTSTTLTITGLDVGDFIVGIFFPGAAAAQLETSWDITGSGANNVTIYLKNPTGSAVDLASGTLRVIGKKRNGG